MTLCFPLWMSVTGLSTLFHVAFSMLDVHYQNFSHPRIFQASFMNSFQLFLILSLRMYLFLFEFYWIKTFRFFQTKTYVKLDPNGTNTSILHTLLSSKLWYHFFTVEFRSVGNYEQTYKIMKTQCENKNRNNITLESHEHIYEIADLIAIYIFFIFHSYPYMPVCIWSKKGEHNYIWVLQLKICSPVK